jgi:D-alanyl-D-alanine carboxypeptidase
VATIAQPRARAVWPAAGLAVLAAAAILGGRAAFQSGTQPARPDLQRILDGLVTGIGRIAPGATAYVSGPRGTWLGSAGLASVKTRAPMSPETRVRLESVSKIWTATLVLQLAQEGRLRVTDTVERWLPGTLPYGNRITIRQLLTMRSGLIDNNDIVRRPEYYLARVKDAKLRAQLLAIGRRLETHPAAVVSPVWWIRFAAWQPLLFPPGTQFHYSNIGYDLLGLIAERAGGRSLPELYRERIFRPLGLHATAYDPQGPIAGPHATGYAFAANGALTDTTDRNFGVGAEGGLVSNAPDTARFLTALMRGKLLDRTWVARMQGPDLWRGGAPSSCGSAFGWSGGGSGYKTEVWTSADGSRLAVLLLNARAGDRGDAASFQALQDLFCAA